MWRENVGSARANKFGKEPPLIFDRPQTKEDEDGMIQKKKKRNLECVASPTHDFKRNSGVGGCQEEETEGRRNEIWAEEEEEEGKRRERERETARLQGGGGKRQ